jgi:succinate dehydrogenase / fumarate reductase cytochrome b subunit
MKVTDHAFRRLRRLQLLTGVVPVGVFLLFHFAVNARAVAGPEAYQATVGAIARLPGLPLLEAVAIGLPIVTHLALAIALGTARPASVEPAYPDPGWRWVQRGTGLYLAIYVVFHVWSVRLAPERLRGERPLFDLMAAQLEHPAVFVLQGLAVLAAAAHFALGLLALGGPAGFALRPAGERVVRGLAIAAFALLAAAGLNALLAFVWPPARWLA